MREKLLSLIKDAVTADERAVFAYADGSFARDETFRDIDIAVYVRDLEENPLLIISDLQVNLSRASKKNNLDITADDFDVQVINHAPFTFLKTIFQEGILLLDRDPDVRTDVIEYVSSKYRECAGLLAEVS